MLNLLALLFGIAAVVVYFVGVKNEKAWGTPVMALLVLGALVLVVANIVVVW